MIERLGPATKYFRSTAKVERKTLEVGGSWCVKMMWRSGLRGLPYGTPCLMVTSLDVVPLIYACTTLSLKKV